ncbi:MAG: hypothetical protein IKS00_07545 [Bacteroidales bacterium]|nr:hypothetical protein [Bacteroidales bacterium]
MKKIILLLAVMMSLSSLTMAQKFENAQTIRQKVADFAKKQGMTIEMPEDNVLTLKKDTINYVMSFSDDNPTFVEIRPFDYDVSTANYACLTKAANLINYTFGGIKATVTPDRQALRLTIDMLVFDAAHVNRLLEHYLDLFDQAWADIQMRYYEFQDNIIFSDIRMPFEVYCSGWANTDFESNVIGESNSIIKASEAQYIHIGLNLTGYEDGEYQIEVKLIHPDGTYSVSQPNEKYTFTSDINVSKGFKFYDLGGWGSNESSFWQPGAYRYELYYKDKLFYIKNFVLE